MRTLQVSVKAGEPEAADPAPAVVGSLADGTDNLSEMWSVQLYESIIDIIEHSSCIAFGNFYHSWVSVLMNHSDLDFTSVIIFI